MQFRNMLTVWLRRKIFAPISKINDFYEYIDKKKVLIVPDIEWNHMSLFDMGDYIGTLKELATNTQDVKKNVSFQTLYRSLGLSYEDEMQKIRKEDIDEIIRRKEREALENMSLNELRALGPSDEIQEAVESPLPGEQTTKAPAGGDEDSGGGGLPGVPPPPQDMSGGGSSPPSSPK